MNLVLLEPDDFFSECRVRLQGRRGHHIREVHRVEVGDELRVGVIGGKVGRGRIETMDADTVEMSVVLDSAPPPPAPIHLVVALPRPKVLDRVIAAAASLGIRHIDIINAWRVEKAYWDSPRLEPAHLREQCVLGLEQAGDTILPTVRLHRLFTPFVREEVPQLVKEATGLVADADGDTQLPAHGHGTIIVAVGPEGGFIQRELDTFEEIGFTRFSLGPRVLRVETAIPCIVGRLTRPAP